ncbi:MAG: ComEA family DNA-binding protein [Candidatus Dormibacteraeota bacterium]|nr:ComEA family DNA-binding protein [Candidatus Dormibacteraeota bacterium]
MTALWWRALGALRAGLYRHSWMLALLLAGGILLTGAYLLWPRGATAAPIVPAAISAGDLETAQDRNVIVYVNGAVLNPGLYTLASGLRVVDAIVAAGGISGNADPGCLPNLAAHLKDAKQITVPFAGHCAKAARKAKLDINSATREQLLAVPGILPGLADAIIAFREANGGFQSLTELKSGLDLDNALYKRLSRYLTVP